MRAEVSTAIVSASAERRIAHALLVLGQPSPSSPLTIVSASRGAADDFARRLSRSAGATFGVRRFSFSQCAAHAAVLALARQGLALSSALASVAMATRATFDAVDANALGYFAPVAGAPGFPRALARTVAELRGAAIAGEALRTVPLVGPDLASLVEHFETALKSAGAADRATMFRVASARLRATRASGTVVLLDVEPDGIEEQRFLEALLHSADRVVATLMPDDRVETLLLAAGVPVEHARVDVDTDLSRLRRYLFVIGETPPPHEPDGSFQLFSAPGEGRECIEIARRCLREAAGGVRFDEMAVLVRTPNSYGGLLEHALSRADVPVWFDRGTRRPHAAGRAFLALLACASERLSAVRFAEYLSLAQVPTGEQGEPAWYGPDDEVVWSAEDDRQDDELVVEDRAAAQEPTDADAPVVVGTLRAPWRWESLIVEAKVVGGNADRWRRRLSGHRAELERRLRGLHHEEGGREADSAAGQHIEATLRQLGHLEAFALPVVESLEQWSAQASWGEWLDRFTSLAPLVLRHPAYVLRVLGDLRPMAAVGPVGLDEVLRVLSDRLLTVEAQGPSRRYGRVFVGTPEQARGRTFRVVFAPGLAERLFPQKPREDPLLLDELRRALDTALATEPRRIFDERRRLRLAVGAASERLYVSYPRLDVGDGRPRVPSFYALDLVRAATGEVPGHEQLDEQARLAGDTSLTWPAPSVPTDAIDDIEHDLAVVRRLLDHQAPDEVRGHGHYLLRLNEMLRRSVTERWQRARPQWCSSDGLTHVTERTRDALAAERLTARGYSVSALQRFASCPYQFLLSAIYRLQPLEVPAPLERIDPRTRGSLIHEIQATLLRTLLAEGPVTIEAIAASGPRLDTIIDRVTSVARDELAPAIERVWVDDVAAMRRDLHGWLAHMTAEPDWVPVHVEFAFGPVPGTRDPASVSTPVAVSGFLLRGAIDVVEVHRTSGQLRVTDFKTGRAPENLSRIVVAGGTVLQPVLYGLVAAQMTGRIVRSGRLYYCTHAGGYQAHEVLLDSGGQRAGVEVLEIIDRSIANGTLMAAPVEQACVRCEFASVCGRDVAERVQRKPRALLGDLLELRRRP